MEEVVKTVTSIAAPVLVGVLLAGIRLLDPNAARRRVLSSDFKATAEAPESAAFKAADAAYARHINDIDTLAIPPKAAVYVRAGNVGGLLCLVFLAASVTLSEVDTSAGSHGRALFLVSAGVVLALATGVLYALSGLVEWRAKKA